MNVSLHNETTVMGFETTNDGLWITLLTQPWWNKCIKHHVTEC